MEFSRLFAGANLNLGPTSNSTGFEQKPAVNPHAATIAAKRASLSDPNRKKMSVLPCTLKTISTCGPSINNEAGCVTIHGRNVNKVLIVAQVLKKTKKETEYSLVLSDATATLPCTFFIDAADTSDPRTVELVGIFEGLKPLGYVKVLATVKLKDDGSKTLTGINAFTLEDMNEITFHQLSAVHCGMQILKGQTKTYMQSLNPTKSDSQPLSSPTDAQGDVTMMSASTVAPTSSTNSAQQATVTGKPVKDIQDFMQQELPRKGAVGFTKKEWVEHAVTSGYEQSSVEAHWEQSIEDLEICPTIDDEHYGLTA